MSSTQGFHAKSVFMTQGTSALRVSSSAEFKIAAGGQFMLDYERTTGKTGTVSNRGITYVLSTAVGSSYILKPPVRGAYKQILIRTKAATSGAIRIRTSSLTIGIGKTSFHSINCASSHGKAVPLGYGITLIGGSTALWLVVDRFLGSTALLFTVTSTTG